MARKFLEMPSPIRCARRRSVSLEDRSASGENSDSDGLTDDEVSFIQARDSFYMATISENGWPYIQHRGGAPGFLRVLDSHRLAFADYKGNRQMLSTGI